MMKKSKGIVLLLILVMGISVFSACAGGTPAPSESKAVTTVEATTEGSETAAVDSEFIGDGLNEAKKITFAYSLATEGYIIEIAKEFGWWEGEFAKDGIEIEFVSFDYGALLIASVGLGEADMGGTVGDTPICTALSNGYDIKALYRVARDPKSMGIVISSAAGINQPEDFNRKENRHPGWIEYA
jgi:ABC-type nitrate/sulfonate/bicarbonate transport systems, periplasmic components